MRTRKILSIAIAISMILLVLAACTNVQATRTSSQTSNSVTESSATIQKKVTIGWIANWLSHEFYQKAQIGMNAKAEELGVELAIVDGNADINAQLNAAENLITKKVDAIMFTCMDQNSLESVVKKANAANIPIITESLTTEGVTSCIGANFLSIGELMGEYIISAAQERGIELRILWAGYPAYQECADYNTAFKKALDDAGIKYKIVEVDTEGMKEKSLQVSTDALTANPDINVIVGINDDATLGAIQAYKAAGLDTTKLLSLTRGFEGEPAIKALLDGSLTAGFCMAPELYGAKMVEAAYKAAREEELPDLTVFQMTIITKDNLDTLFSETNGKYMFDLGKSKNPDIKWLKID